MKTETVNRQIADLLYMHDWEQNSCKCGWKRHTLDVGDDHVDHLADVLCDRFDISPKAT
jgi:hypothetical protein